jgi:hypothetical protein
MAAGNIDAILDGIRDNQVKAADGGLVEEKKITVDGHAGRFYVFKGLVDGEKTVFHVQSWIAGDHILQATTDGDEDVFSPADAAKFFRSIRPL